MILTNDDRLQSIPADHRPRLETVVERVGKLAGESLEHRPEWVLERLQQQALSLATLQYHFQQQQQQIAAQQQQIETQQQQIQALQAELEQSQRAPKRQAAPFRLKADKRNANPKRPGRKGGHRGQWRQPPPASPQDEHIEVLLEQCPHCKQSLDISQQQAVEQTIIEIPKVTPRVIRLRTYRNHCEHCEQRVQSHHPLQVSTATGAASTQLGPHAVGVAAYLNKQLGLPMRKTCDVLHQLTGLSLSPGGLSQAIARAADRLQPDYDTLLEQVRQSGTLHSDETSWWVAGDGYYLWVLTTGEHTYYRIVPARTRDAAKALIGESFDGVLVTDCLNIYDDLNALQHKCYAHHLKAISHALATPAGEHSLYLLELRALLHIAMVLKEEMAQLKESTIATIRQWLEQRTDTLLRHPRGDPDDAQGQQEEKIRRRLSNQRDHLFTFLDYPNVEATNNAAERQIRPAVIARKISCGNKTLTGAHTWEILASLAATAKQQGTSFIDLVADAISLDSSDQ